MSEICDKLYEDDIVYLKREPNNPYDVKAIQVVTVEGYVIGYIPKEENFILKNLIFCLKVKSSLILILLCQVGHIVCQNFMKKRLILSL